MPSPDCSGWLSLRRHGLNNLRCRRRWPRASQGSRNRRYRSRPVPPLAATAGRVRTRLNRGGSRRPGSRVLRRRTCPDLPSRIRSCRRSRRRSRSPRTRRRPRTTRTSSRAPRRSRTSPRSLPGNFKDTKYKWYGFVRLDGIYDFRPIGSTDELRDLDHPGPAGAGPERGAHPAVHPDRVRHGDAAQEPRLDDQDPDRDRLLQREHVGGVRVVPAPAPLRLGRLRAVPDRPGGVAVHGLRRVPERPGLRRPRRAWCSCGSRSLAVHFPIGEKFRLTMGVEQPYSDIQWLRERRAGS